jgi:hypothetical protein
VQQIPEVEAQVLSVEEAVAIVTTEVEVDTVEEVEDRVDHMEEIATVEVVVETVLIATEEDLVVETVGMKTGIMEAQGDLEEEGIELHFESLDLMIIVEVAEEGGDEVVESERTANGANKKIMDQSKDLGKTTIPSPVVAVEEVEAIDTEVRMILMATLQLHPPSWRNLGNSL